MMFHFTYPVCRRPRRIPKAIVTRIYADQLKPLYPYLTKTHIKAALTLSDNNMHESRLLLDMKYKMLQMKGVVQSTLFVNASELMNLAKNNAVGENTFSDDKKLHVADDSFSTITATPSGSSSVNSSSSNLQEGTNTANNKVSTDTQSYGSSGGSSDFASTSCDTSISSTVYDFSESESETEPVESWLDYRRGIIKRSPPNKKIGVVITRCTNGYKACLL